MSCFNPSMYARRRAIAAPTGLKKITLRIARKTMKLTSWTRSVPSISSIEECCVSELVGGAGAEDLRDERQHAAADREEQEESEHEPDDRERLQNADAQEEEREDVAARFGLARDRLDRLRRDDTVADGGTQGDGRDDQGETQDQDGGYDGIRTHD